MKLSTRHIHDFQKMILNWWKTHRRDLPWRRTRDPYRIMVSEVMLQQTQVLRVLTKYREFIATFPTVNHLAHASPAQVLRIWKGMGYNRRALYLQRAAKIICDQYNGYFPITYELLTALPGLGTYTARAILVFAYGQETTLVDTNIRQIITHFFFSNQAQARLSARQVPALKGLKGWALEKEIEEIARQLIPPGKSWEWHQALMDYGALELQKVNGKSMPARLDSAKRAGNAGKKVGSKTIPFRESNRFYRGRIIDRLREGESPENELIKELRKEYAKPLAFIRSIIVGLIKDGLIERTSQSILRLPEA